MSHNEHLWVKAGGELVVRILLSFHFHAGRQNLVEPHFGVVVVMDFGVAFIGNRFAATHGCTRAGDHDR